MRYELTDHEWAATKPMRYTCINAFVRASPGTERFAVGGQD